MSAERLETHAEIVVLLSLHPVSLGHSAYRVIVGTSASF